MDISPEMGQALSKASRLGEVTDEPARSLGIAALAAVVTERHGVTTETPGMSWLGEGGDVNTLLSLGDRFVHARADGESASATSYPGPVATVEAADVARATTDSVAPRVTTWHVTLSDGAVITLRAGGGASPEALADFVRTHLTP